jgi:porin
MPAKATASRPADHPWLLVLVALVLGWSMPGVAAEFGASWTGDFATVTSGGLQQDGRHMGLLELSFDHEFKWRARELTLHLSGQHRYGGGFSEHEVGDLQTVSNIDAEPGTRLLEAWLAIPLTSHTSVLFGRYDLNGEFDAIEAGGLFLGSSHGIGPDISQTGAVGPSIFPNTAFGIRVQHASERGGALRIAAIDVEASDEYAYGDSPFAGGPMLALEYQWPLQAATVKTGVWRYTRTCDSMYPEERGAQYGGYASVERRFGENLVAYGRVGVANADVSRIGLYTGGGIVHTGGLLPGRDDSIGFAIAYARNGRGYDDAMHDVGVPVTSGEQVYELTWRVPVGEHVVLQPDVQYVVDPDSNPAIDDALVVILRVELSL